MQQSREAQVTQHDGSSSVCSSDAADGAVADSDRHSGDDMQGLVPATTMQGRQA